MGQTPIIGEESCSNFFCGLHLARNLASPALTQV